MGTIRYSFGAAGPTSPLDDDITSVLNAFRDVMTNLTIIMGGQARIAGLAESGTVSLQSFGTGDFVRDGEGRLVSGTVATIDFYGTSGPMEQSRVMTLSFDWLDASQFPALAGELAAGVLSGFDFVGDFVTGQEAIDEVSGGSAAYALNGDDVITLTAFDDRLSANLGDDRLDGGAGNDDLRGDDGLDTLLGGEGDDTLDGGAGDDRLEGGDGVDSLSGGAGDDRIVASAGNDVAFGGDGADVAYVAGARSAFWTRLYEDGSITLRAGDGETDVFHGVETFVFVAENGDEEVVAAADVAAPNRAPTAPAFVGAATVSETAAAGVVVGALTASDPDEDAVTFSVAGEVFQVVGAELRLGVSGVLDFEDAPSVQLFVSANDGEAGTGAPLTIAVADGAERLVLGAGADTFVDRGVTEISVDGAGGNDRITGTANADDLLGGAGADSLYGGAGDDRLSGGTEADALYGGAGADSLYGGTGDDRLDGGAGADRMEGGAGDDVYLLDAASDAAVETSATGGTDRVETAIGLTLGRWIENGVLTADAAAGARLTGNGLDNALTGNARTNALLGGDGDDTLSGGGGGDTLTGGDGADALSGGDGADALTGGAGADRLSGGDGADRLTGGAGADRMTGGAGADDFVFLSTRDSAPRDRDAIVDFTVRIDDIDLDAIDANLGRGGDQAFRFLGDDAFSGRAGELRYDGKLVLGDVDGDRRADLVIDVADGLALRATDFIL